MPTERERQAQQARNQERSLASMASAIPGSCRARSWQFTHRQVSSIALALYGLYSLFFSTLSVPSITAYQSHSSSSICYCHIVISNETVVYDKGRCQKYRTQLALQVSWHMPGLPMHDLVENLSGRIVF